MHHENLVADGDQPVLVDVETICHPLLPHPMAADPARRAMKSSVYRTGLLPEFVVDEEGLADISGSGRGDPADHTGALLAGFRQGYDAIMRDRQQFAALVRDLAHVETRVIVRSTRHYARLLAATTRPDLLHDAGEREQALVGGLAGDPFDGALVRHEVTDLWAGDVPLFRTTPGSREVVTSDGHRLHGLFERPGLDDGRTALARMGDIDRRDQEWIIAAAIASREATSHDDTTPLPGHIADTAADPQRLLTAACAIADQIVSRTVAHRGRVNWQGLEHVDDRQWLVLPMGAGLANGYLGVALILAQRGALSGIARYSEVTRDAITAVPTLFDTLAEHPAMVTAIGCGGLHGLGGIAFGLARIAALQDDAQLRDLAGTAVDLAAMSAPGSLDWATGLRASPTAPPVSPGRSGRVHPTAFPWRGRRRTRWVSGPPGSAGAPGSLAWCWADRMTGREHHTAAGPHFGCRYGGQMTGATAYRRVLCPDWEMVLLGALIRSGVEVT